MKEIAEIYMVVLTSSKYRLTSNTLCMIIDFQEKTVKTPVDGISPLDFAAFQML